MSIKSKRKSPTKLERLVRIWIKASQAYNYDCNTRLDIKVPDRKRNILFWKANEAFSNVEDCLRKTK